MKEKFKDSLFSCFSQFHFYLILQMVSLCETIFDYADIQVVESNLMPIAALFCDETCAGSTEDSWGYY